MAGAAADYLLRVLQPGDVLGVLGGETVDRRMVALDLNALRAVPLVIGVARGRHKAAAILGAVRGGYVKSLVTDDVTAREIMSLAGAATGGAEPREAAPIGGPAPRSRATSD